MNILNNGRFGIGAVTGAMMRKCVTKCVAHATERKQFGNPLKDYGLIKEKFAVLAANTYANESLAYMTTGLIDRGGPSCEVEAACCKVFGSEKSFEGINEAIQIMGGMGFMKDYPFERYMRDCRILSIFEGTNEILRLMIALTGMKSLGERMKKLGKLAKNPLADPMALIGEASTRVTNRVAPGKVSGVHPSLDKYAKRLRSDTVAFGGACEGLLIKHGKNIMHEQLQLKRVANCVIDLYATTAVLSRASKAIVAKSDSADHEKSLAMMFAAGAHQRIGRELKEIGGYAASHDARIRKVADEIFAHGGYVAAHPIGV